MVYLKSEQREEQLSMPKGGESEREVGVEKIERGRRRQYGGGGITAKGVDRMQSRRVVEVKKEKKQT